MKEIEFLSSHHVSQGWHLPAELQEIVELFLESQQKIKLKYHNEEVESKVKGMCYEMMIGVLETH
jgi:hypothetical protein